MTLTGDMDKKVLLTDKGHSYNPRSALRGGLMRIFCQQTILMIYHVLFFIFEKAAKFEIGVCCKLKLALYGLSQHIRFWCQQTILMKCHTLFDIFEKAATFENDVCCKL